MALKRSWVKEPLGKYVWAILSNGPWVNGPETAPSTLPAQTAKRVYYEVKVNEI
jgi:hypothetical protein